jgi:hypothetical protein
MLNKEKDIILCLFFLLCFGALFTPKVNAASLINVSDVLTNSRPSAASPLSAPLTATQGQVQIVDNGSLFLASDSAVIYRDAANESSDVALNIASMSAGSVPSQYNRIVFFSNTNTFAHHQGVALISNVTAKHTIQFTTISTIPANGYIVLSFPNGGNTASPSASGFSFNNLATGNVTFAGTGVSCSGANLTVAAPTITCHTTTQISGGTVVTAVVGSTTPQLINPVALSNCIGALTCNADAWKVTIQTQDNNSINLDYGALKAATIQPVQVIGTVEPTIQFSIAGYNNSSTTSFSALGATGCGAEYANTGIDSTATTVNLGLLNNGNINKVAQILTITTNGSSGYAITATTSGHLINPASGFWINDANGTAGSNPLTANDTPRPLSIASGSADFGISPCGSRVPTNIWGLSGTIVSNSNFSNPWNTGANSFTDTIASYTGGPVSTDYTVVRYAAAVSGTTPAGLYLTNISYIATATF